MLFSSGTTAERIVLVGDSAGGNFAFTLCMKLKELGLRMPDSIVSIYPNVNATTSVTPSRISALWDPILPLGVMLACQAVCCCVDSLVCSIKQIEYLCSGPVGLHRPGSHTRDVENEKGESSEDPQGSRLLLTRSRCQVVLSHPGQNKVGWL